MSQPNNAPNATWYPVRVMRILLIIFGIMVMVAIPIFGYIVGNFIGIHMSASDVDQGYAYGGLLYTVYNATHNPVFLQEAQISQAQGIVNGQSDVNNLSMLGLLAGVIADVPIVFLIVREYERMES